MNKRLSKLPANSFVATLKALQAQIAALKQAQRISSASGVLGYASSSSDEWDATGTIGTDSDTAWQSTAIYVTWTGDGSQDIAFANVSFDLFVNGTDSAHQLTPQSNTWTDGTRSASVSYGGYSSISHHTYEVLFELGTYKEITYYVKGHAVASSPGTISVEVEA